MRTRMIGNQGPVVASLALGCMGMSQGYGVRDDDESIATIRAAIDVGINLIDTATTYGGGHNEALVGQAITGRRDRVVLATKFGIVRPPGQPTGVDGSPANARACCERSLRRMGVDHLDLFYLHRVDTQVPVEESIGAMGELVIEGKVRHLGISEATADEVRRAATTHRIAALQSEWSLWCRNIEDQILPAVREAGIAVLPYSPLGRGFLTGTAPAVGDLADDDWRRPDERFTGERRHRNDTTLAALAPIAADLGITPAQLSIAWLLAQGDDVVPVVGTSSRRHLAENVAAIDVVLGPNELDAIEACAPRHAWSGTSNSFHRATERSPSVRRDEC